MTYYPNVILFRYSKYSDIDTFFTGPDLKCSINITQVNTFLNKLYDPNYHILVTYGNSEQEYYKDVYEIIVSRMNKRWIHFTELPANINAFNNAVNYCFINNVLMEREDNRPTFSIFTTCYKSYEKIVRAYISVKLQKFRDWEWVILDDSPEEQHFTFLQNQFKDDSRVRLYKRDKNSGSIGNVKNEVVSLCRGQYVIEFDHDDEILPDCLQDAVTVFTKYPEVGFVYMDFMNIYEDGRNFCYGDGTAKGYAGYYCEKYNGRWVNTYSTANVNNITLSHIVCLPNHPRIWRKSVLLSDAIGNYSEFLAICDDQEVIMRTALNTKMAKVNKLSYIQYMNDGGNNFSLIRNSEINRIGPEQIVPQFYEKFKVHEKMKDLGAYEDEKYWFYGADQQIWRRDPAEYEHVYCNLVINLNYKCQYGIIGIDAFYANLDKIHELYNNPENDLLLLDNSVHVDVLCQLLEEHNLDRMRCYAIPNASQLELTQYFKLIYKSCEKYEVISHNNTNNKSIIKPNYKIIYNSKHAFRHNIINSISQPTDKYLEVGVEYGQTFKEVHFTNKVGVDPDPKVDDTATSLLIVKLTSDEFFANNTSKFNIIFLDGMHQAEYILRDINNSIRCLTKPSTLCIDDIFPQKHSEQMKIPGKHYYENGILKYGEPWTGDVWKVIYYVLQHFSGHFDFSYHTHHNYRGVGVFTNIKKFKIPTDDKTMAEINAYDYYKDFENYIALANSYLTK